MPTFILFAVLFIVAALLSGCQEASSSAPPSGQGSTVATQPGEPKTEQPGATGVRQTQPAPAGEIAGSLATPTDSYKTAHQLRKKKDIEGLKKMMSKEIKDFLTMMGEAEKKSLDDMLREMVEKPQAEKAEARNEKIDGDRATIEYLTETGGWKTMDFEKVNGQWLLAFPKADKTGDREAEK